MEEQEHGADIPEKAPEKNQYPAVWDLVLADMEKRKEMGFLKYKTHLQPFNGRKALWDAYQEALDLAVYLRQAIFEADYQRPAGEESMKQQYTTTIQVGDLGVDGIKFSENAINEMAPSIRGMKVSTNFDEKIIVGEVAESEREGNAIKITITLDRATSTAFAELISQARLSGALGGAVEKFHLENGRLVIDKMGIAEVSLIPRVFDPTISLLKEKE